MTAPVAEFAGSDRGELVFVDVGAHRGQSAAIALGPDFRFDRVVSVEPDPDMAATLEARFAGAIGAGRYAVAPVALADRCGEGMLYGANAGGGASLIRHKFAAAERPSRPVRLCDWATFLAAHGLERARLVVKINAEGAEVAILAGILAGPHAGIVRMMVDYDIIKTPFGAWKKWASVRRLRAHGIPFDLAENVMTKGGPRPGLENWLRSLPEVVAAPAPAARPEFRRRARIRYLELVSALGIRHDLLKRRHRERG